MEHYNIIRLDGPDEGKPVNGVKTHRLRYRNERGLLIVMIITLAVVSLWAGSSIAKGSKTPLFLALTMITLAILVPNPIRGVYFAYPIMFLIPFGIFWVKFPLFNSPLDVLTSLTMVLGLIRLAVERRKLPKSNLYLPILMCASILGAYAVAGHGVGAAFQLFRFVQGMWPFFLLILLLDTPNQAKKVLLSIILTMIILSLLWLPGLITAGAYGGDLIRNVNSASETTSIAQSISLVYQVGNLSSLTLLAVSFVSIAILGLFMTSPKKRLALFFCFILTAGVVLWATFAAAVLTLIAGAALVFIFGLFSKEINFSSSFTWLILVVLIISMLITILPQGTRTFERILNPQEDASASYRIWDSKQGIQAFSQNPFIGYGSVEKPTYSSQGVLLSKHSTFIPLAFEFGLLFIIPFIWLLICIIKGYYRLINRAQRRLEKGIAIGMAASFGAAIIAGFATSVFMETGQDAIIWLFIGLMTVWNSWLDENPEAELVV